MSTVNGTSYNDETPQAVINILEASREHGFRIRIYYGNRETGAVWNDLPMRGRVGRSTGIKKIPLLIPTARSSGGEGILDHCIVAIEESPGGRILYKNPKVGSLQDAES